MNDEYKKGVNLDPLEQCEGRYRMEDEDLLPKGCLRATIVGTILLGIIILYVGLQTFEVI
jgi:hypothetical protein